MAPPAFCGEFSIRVVDHRRYERRIALRRNLNKPHDIRSYLRRQLELRPGERLSLLYLVEDTVTTVSAWDRSRFYKTCQACNFSFVTSRALVFRLHKRVPPPRVPLLPFSSALAPADLVRYVAVLCRLGSTKQGTLPRLSDRPRIACRFARSGIYVRPSSRGIVVRMWAGWRCYVEVVIVVVVTWLIMEVFVSNNLRRRNHYLYQPRRRC